jgi:hypothetical protein
MPRLNTRQAYALTHPLHTTDPTAILPLRGERRHPAGMLIRTILAVDR